MVYYDHNLIGAPELLVPGMKPVGPVTSKYPAWMFGGIYGRNRELTGEVPVYGYSTLVPIANSYYTSFLSNDYFIDYYNNSKVNGAGGFTIVLIFRMITPSSFAPLISTGNHLGGYGWSLQARTFDTPDNLMFNIITTSANYSAKVEGTSWEDGNWHVVVGSWDGANMSVISTDGFASTATAGTMKTNGVRLRFNAFNTYEAAGTAWDIAFAQYLPFPYPVRELEKDPYQFLKAI